MATADPRSEPKGPSGGADALSDERLEALGQVTTEAHARYSDDDMLTVADAAFLARRSIRTLRRAYLSGKLVAHRDGNGRSVSIRYGDLRAWQMAKLIAAEQRAAPSRPQGRVGTRKRAAGPSTAGSVELLTAARKRRAGRARASAAARPTGGQASSRKG